ncbi:uncharacterized protein LOC120277653 [Dioscorea cayenensis subsp. rotundata]|uniref:Uncharacterized protein LOC120277653 n=1 Tax=Dioscorea cayennensis subsp. rotundata TaxID=55577 RepID=A0AB40CMZ6_DIOCR|nr:uncharacterized protein LOC120277653 [Dioscorea cayenensis subsp. rotundata]
MIDATKESRPLAEEERGKDNILLAKLTSILNQEEIYWKQKAGVTWLKEDDGNTSYFHSVTNGHRNRNFIPWVWHDNQRVGDIGRISDIFTSFYKDLYGSTKEHRFQINWSNLLGTKEQCDLTALDIPFTHEEIREVVFGMSVDKAPGPNGLPILFFQKFWEIIKLDIFKLCDDFYWGKR